MSYLPHPNQNRSLLQSWRLDATFYKDVLSSTSQSESESSTFMTAWCNVLLRSPIFHIPIRIGIFYIHDGLMQRFIMMAYLPHPNQNRNLLHSWRLDATFYKDVLSSTSQSESESSTFMTAWCNVYKDVPSSTSQSESESSTFMTAWCNVL